MTDTAWADLLPAGTVCMTTPIAGRPPFPVRHGKRGEPLWPDGRVGSITHAGGYRTIATAAGDQIQALGIDMEPFAPLPPEVWPRIFSEEELEALIQIHVPERGRVALSLWCMKEALFKALLGRIPFDEIELCYQADGWHPTRLLGKAIKASDSHDTGQLVLRTAVSGGWQRAAAWSCKRVTY